MRRPLALAVAAAMAPAGAAQGAITPPRACEDKPQITDPTGDGHHANEDVTAAWFSEEAGRLQAVIQVRTAVWEPAHEDSEAADFAMLFTSGGAIRYVRVAPQRGGEPRFDHGTWTEAGGFASAGPTTGTLSTGGGGSAVIDVPEATGAVAGARLASPFVLTADGAEGAQPHWVDKAPGGTSPAGDASFGADYVVGSCRAAAGTPYELPGVTGVSLRAPGRLRGGGVATITGTVTPAVQSEVAITAGDRRREVTTGADGRYSLRLPIRETTVLRARVGDVSSQSVTVTVRSIVTLNIRDGVAKGRVRPALPGRVLLLRKAAAKPSAVAKAEKGRYRIGVRRLELGRYQAVFIPSGERAERSTSKTGVIR